MIANDRVKLTFFFQDYIAIQNIFTAKKTDLVFLYEWTLFFLFCAKRKDGHLQITFGSSYAGLGIMRINRLEHL